MRALLYAVIGVVLLWAIFFKLQAPAIVRSVTVSIAQSLPHKEAYSEIELLQAVEKSARNVANCAIAGFFGSALMVCVMIYGAIILERRIRLKSDAQVRNARGNFSPGPLGTWSSSLGGGHDGNIGMRLTFHANGSGNIEEWGFDESYDPDYVSEPTFKWRNLGVRKIEITHRGQVRVVEYDFKMTKDAYGNEQLRMFELRRKPDELGEVGFWISPFSLVRIAE